MIENNYDEMKIKLLKDYNLRKIQPNLNEIYLKTRENDPIKLAVIKEYYCMDCNKFPLILFKCNHQFCKKFLCTRCLKLRKNSMNGII